MEINKLNNKYSSELWLPCQPLAKRGCLAGKQTLAAKNKNM